VAGSGRLRPLGVAATLEDVPTLLLVHHSPSDAVVRLREALVDGATDEAIEGVELVERPALEAVADDVLAADAVLLLTTANFGYMSGALKHFFDVSFPALEHATTGLPYALVVKGNTDGTGAIRAVEAIATGMSWRRVRPSLELLGPPSEDELARCRELGAELAAGLSVGAL
jgi:NAD(P)H-dependent FMN reductase